MTDLITAMATVVAVNLIPTVEQLGGITTGIALGLTPFQAFLISITVNCLLFLPIYFGAGFVYKQLLRFETIRTKFDRFLSKARAKVNPYIEKYGIVGVAFFIALPGPLTGTYTASLVSWALDFDWKKAWLSIILGSLIGGTLILLGSYGVLGFLKTIGY